MRHDFLGVGDGLELVDLGGVDEDGEVVFAFVDELEGFGVDSRVFDVVFEILFVDAEEFFEDEFVKDGDVEVTPGFGVVCRKLIHNACVLEAEDPVGIFCVQGEFVFVGGLDGCHDFFAELVEVLLSGDWDFFDGEIFLEFLLELVEVDVGHGDESVGGEDGEAGVEHVAEDDHDVVEGGVGVCVFGFFADFGGEVAGGLVAVVAVGDEEDLVAECFLDGGDGLGVVEFPEVVGETVVAFDFDLGGAESVFDGVSYLVVGVHVHELDGFEVGVGGAHEVEAVCFGFGEGFFVGFDGLVVGVEFEEDEEAVHGFFVAFDGVVDAVGVDGGCGGGGEDVVLLPLVEEGGGSGVAVVGVGVGGFDFVEDESDEVVGVVVVELLLEFVVDDVVGG